MASDVPNAASDSSRGCESLSSVSALRENDDPQGMTQDTQGPVARLTSSALENLEDMPLNDKIAHMHNDPQVQTLIQLALSQQMQMQTQQMQMQMPLDAAAAEPADADANSHAEPADADANSHGEPADSDADADADANSDGYPEAEPAADADADAADATPADADADAADAKPSDADTVYRMAQQRVHEVEMEMEMAKAQAEADTVALQEKFDAEGEEEEEDPCPQAHSWLAQADVNEGVEPASCQPEDGVLPPNDDGPAPPTLWGCSKCRHNVAIGCRTCNPGRFSGKPNQTRYTKKRPAASMDLGSGL